MPYQPDVGSHPRSVSIRQAAIPEPVPEVGESVERQGQESAWPLARREPSLSCPQFM
jgi:hypothetical protein